MFSNLEVPSGSAVARFTGSSPGKTGTLWYCDRAVRAASVHTTLEAYMRRQVEFEHVPGHRSTIPAAVTFEDFRRIGPLTTPNEPNGSSCK